MDSKNNEEKIENTKKLSDKEFMTQLEKQISEVKQIFSDYEKIKNKYS